jgi:hypothetical protein
VERPGEKQERLPKYYADSMMSVVPKKTSDVKKEEVIRMGQRWLH